MAEYIECRNCESPDCKGCNIKTLETMLNNGKFDCLMNANRCINPSAVVAPVRHGRWEEADDGDGVVCSACGIDFCTLLNDTDNFIYCPNCGAKMDGDAT